MKTLLTFLVENIVEVPDAVQITEKSENGIKLLSLKVDPLDMGKIIGKEGKVIKAIRAALKVKSFATQARFHLVLEDQPKADVEN